MYITDKTFDRLEILQKGEYENCIFNHCNFADADFSGYKFTDCIFHSCNLSMVKLSKTALCNIQFKDSKMLGLRFETCNEFGLSFSFQGCQLNHSSFYKLSIKKTNFRDTQLQEIDFTEADLTAAIFDNCNLQRATFERTVLEKADLRTSYNYSIDPALNRIKKAKFSLNGVIGLLEKYDIEIEHH
ncbi:MAG: pentapeptide repeat-containing protein [Flavobacteriales bacterium]|jgi:fluoroquinolone resistance protein